MNSQCNEINDEYGNSWKKQICSQWIPKTNLISNLDLYGGPGMSVNCIRDHTDTLLMAWCTNKASNLLKFVEYSSELLYSYKTSKRPTVRQMNPLHTKPQIFQHKLYMNTLPQKISFC